MIQAGTATRGLIGEVEAPRARLWARLQTAALPAPVAISKAVPDHLLTVAEAAERLGVSKRWIYRRVASLPFAKRLSEGSLRFSSAVWRSGKRVARDPVQGIGCRRGAESRDFLTAPARVPARILDPPNLVHRRKTP